jgi:hypothetical protein
MRTRFEDGRKKPDAVLIDRPIQVFPQRHSSPILRSPVAPCIRIGHGLRRSVGVLFGFTALSRRRSPCSEDSALGYRGSRYPSTRTSRGQLPASSDQLFDPCLARRRFLGRRRYSRGKREGDQRITRYKPAATFGRDVLDAANLVDGCTGGTCAARAWHG